MTRKCIESAWDSRIAEMRGERGDGVERRSADAAIKLGFSLLELMKYAYLTSDGPTSYEDPFYSRQSPIRNLADFNGDETDAKAFITIHYRQEVDQERSRSAKWYRRGITIPKTIKEPISIEAGVHVFNRSFYDRYGNKPTLLKTYAEVIDDTEKVTQVEQVLAGIAESMNYHYRPVEEGFQDPYNNGEQ